MDGPVSVFLRPTMGSVRRAKAFRSLSHLAPHRVLVYPLAADEPGTGTDEDIATPASKPRLPPQLYTASQFRHGHGGKTRWKAGTWPRPVSQETGRRPYRQTAVRGVFRERHGTMRVFISRGGGG